jgi:hypothetical protein
MNAIGKCCWVIADGYLPGWEVGPKPEMESHEAVCILNTGGVNAQVELMLYFEDRDPVGPYRIRVPAERTVHQRTNDLTDPQRVPENLGYSCVVTSDQPIVVQHTRLDSRQSENALMSTIAYPV